MSEQMTRVTDVVDLLNKVCFVQYNTGWSSTSLAKDAVREITRLRQLLSEAEKGARAAALEEAAKLANEWKCSLRPGNIQRLYGHKDAARDIAAKILALQSEER